MNIFETCLIFFRIFLRHGTPICAFSLTKHISINSQKLNELLKTICLNIYSKIMRQNRHNTTICLKNCSKKNGTQRENAPSVSIFIIESMIASLFPFSFSYKWFFCYLGSDFCLLLFFVIDCILKFGSQAKKKDILMCV